MYEVETMKRCCPILRFSRKSLEAVWSLSMGQLGFKGYEKSATELEGDVEKKKYLGCAHHQLEICHALTLDWPRSPGSYWSNVQELLRHPQ